MLLICLGEMAILRAPEKFWWGQAPTPPSMSAGGVPLHPRDLFFASAGGDPLHPLIDLFLYSEPVRRMKLFP